MTIKPATSLYPRTTHHLSPFSPQIIPIASVTPTPGDPIRRETHLTTANLRDNEPFGDVMQAKDEGTFWLWGNNFNGLSIDDSGGDFMELCDEAATMQADIILGTEHTPSVP
jgi:hypothetical protein